MYPQQMRAYEVAGTARRILDYVDRTTIRKRPACRAVVVSQRRRRRKHSASARRAALGPELRRRAGSARPLRFNPRQRASGWPPTTRAQDRGHRVQLGRLEHVNGASHRQTDLLGIFGREGLDLATLGLPPTAEPAAGVYAFRMYRNYDGSHGRFGDTSACDERGSGQLADPRRRARGATRAWTLMVANKTGTPLTSGITLRLRGRSDGGEPLIADSAAVPGDRTRPTSRSPAAP